MKDLLGDAFIFAKGNELWKAKRKATSHAFYKDKVVHMLEILKVKISESFTKWIEAIDKSESGCATIDITEEFELIFARNIIHIAFGEDINDEKIEIYMKPDPNSTKPCKLESAKLNTVIKELFDQALKAIQVKLKNPLFMLSYRLFGKTIAFSQFEQNLLSNCHNLRKFLVDYV